MNTLPILYLAAMPKPMREWLTHSKDMLADHQFFTFLIQWQVLVVVGLIVLTGVIKKSKGLVVTLLALYAFTAIFHFIGGGVGDMTGDSQGNTLMSVGHIALVAVSIFVVALIVLYFLFIKE